MDQISIKITFDDLPVFLQHNIISFFNILSTLLISITITLYFCIFNYIYKNYYSKNTTIRLP